MSHKYFIKNIGYLSPNDKKKIDNAIEFASTYHKGQVRLSGQPYINHAIDVAGIIAELNLDTDTIIAAILHDTIEDTPANYQQIKKLFGTQVARLVDGVTKLDRVKISKSWFLPFKKHYEEIDRYENQVETLRKMFVAMSKDLRVIIIKLADRLSNLKTLSYLSRTKQLRIAQETMDIYAPIANRLGMGDFKCRLEDLSFPYLYQKEYKWVRELAIPEIESRRKFLKKASRKLSNHLKKQNIEPNITYRAKRWYSLYKKLLNHDRDINKIYDIVALRIIVPTIEDCYNALGQVHYLWKPLPGRIKDYIALPKPNGYQSIHTTVFADNGVVTEVQIRTLEMEKQAEFGIAAHWQYNENKKNRRLPRQQLSWVNELAKWQASASNAKDLKQALEIDFFKDRIFVFTPNGDVKDLPNGASAIDFAYAIHTAVGNQCSGAKVNNKIAAISTKLHNGDIVEIIKKRNAKPTRDWLKYARTEHSKESIKKFLKEK